jgi:hypothetical protein
MRTRTYNLRGKLPRHFTQSLTKYDFLGNVILPNPWQTVIKGGVTSTQWMRDKGVISDQLRSFRKDPYEVHNCIHTRTKVDWGGLTGATATLELRNSGSTNVWVFQQHAALAYVFEYMASSLSDAFLTDGVGSDYTTSDYVNPDWFAIQDSFREACDSFIPNNMLLGETMFEYDLLLDVIKIAINPTRIIPSFIKLVKAYGLEKSNLGRIRRTLKDASRGTLSYSFAVKPALTDIASMIDANRKVRNRLDYLVGHGGKYVPVRVRKNFHSSISNSDLSLISPTATQSLRKQCSGKFVTGTAGGWGRVREELNYSEAWKAYQQYFGLSKIAGLAWELIPFSFVLDWFTNAQERINYLTRFSTGSPFTEFRGITYSMKQLTKETVYLVPGYNPTLTGYVVSPDKPFPLFTIEKSNYERYLNIPSTSGVVDMSTLGLFHAITGGALLVQRFLR